MESQTQHKAEEQAPSRLQVAGVVTFYMVAALVMVLVNKAVLNSSPQLPYSFLFVQTITAVILLQIAAVLFPTNFEIKRLSLDEVRQMAPLVGVGLAGLIFNTLCLRSVDTTFFQIARGMLLPMTIVVSAFATQKSPRRNVIVAATVVTIGFMIGVKPSSSFISHPLKATVDMASAGLLYGLLSSFLAAVHAVMRKFMVGKMPSLVQMSYTANVLCSTGLVVMVLLNGELATLQKTLTNPEDRRVFMIGGGVTGVFGTFLSLAGLLSIKVTSPVTHMFSSAGRSVLQTILGVAIFGDIITTDRLSSLMVITAGTLYFTYISNARPSAPPSRPMTGTPSTTSQGMKQQLSEGTRVLSEKV